VFERGAVVLLRIRVGGESVGTISSEFGVLDDEAGFGSAFDEVVGDVGSLFLFVAFGIAAEDVRGTAVEKGAAGGGEAFVEVVDE